MGGGGLQQGPSGRRFTRGFGVQKGMPGPKEAGGVHSGHSRGLRQKPNMWVGGWRRLGGMGREARRPREVNSSCDRGLRQEFQS